MLLQQKFMIQARSFIDFEQQETNKFAAYCWAKYLLEKKENWVILHIAATGLNNSDRIVEICVVSRHGSVMLDTLIKPNKPNLYPLYGMQYNCQIMTGITDDMLVNAPEFVDVYPRLRSLIKGKNILCYSTKFTLQKIQRMCELYELPIINGIWWDFGEMHAKRENSCYVGKSKYDIPKLFKNDEKRRAKIGAINIYKIVQEMAQPLVCPVLFKTQLFPKKQLFCDWRKWIDFSIKRPSFYWGTEQNKDDLDDWDKIPF